MFPILQTDIAGNPTDWISHRQAIALIASDRVIANLGDNEFDFFGGHNRFSGLRSQVTVGSILLTKERVMQRRLSKDYEPPFSNRLLMVRDQYTCQYCGDTFPPRMLTRDHIIPKSRSNDDSWQNSALSCKDCNHDKRDRTPEEWGKLLINVPYVPNFSEYLFLKSSRRIAPDQLMFLQERFPKNSRLL